MENLKTQRQISIITIQRYYDTLKKLEEATREEFVFLRLQNFLTDCGINSKTASVLDAKGIIKKIPLGNRKRGFRYKWNTIKPSLQMAKALIEEIRRIEIEKGQNLSSQQRINFKRLPNTEETRNVFFGQIKDFENKEQIEKIPVAEVKKEVKEIFKEKPTRKRKETKAEEKKEISLFWGLFKYKSNK